MSTEDSVAVAVGAAIVSIIAGRLCFMFYYCTVRSEVEGSAGDVARRVGVEK